MSNYLTKLLPKEVLSADVIYVSHSGGKDSQAMLALIKRYNLLHKVVIVHSDLGRMEWESMHSWIEKNSFGLPCHVVRSEMDFFDVARKYKRLPSGMNQFCTDFLKTQPIKTFIHNHMYEHGHSTAINATGMRAEESPRRAKKASFTLSKGSGTSNMHMPKKHESHTIYDWLPILNYSHAEVIQEITNANQSVHKVYTEHGFSRLSCVICVNGRIGEHHKASKLRPELAKEMADLERELGKTIRLQQKNGVRSPKYMDTYLEGLI